MPIASSPLEGTPKRRLPDLAAMASRLVTIFDDLSNYERVWRSAPGKWSCAEVVGHLVDAELVFGYRIRCALAESGKTLDGFDQDKWVASQRWNDLPVDDSIRTFDALRRSTLSLLGLLTEEEWTRHYIHSTRGRQTITDTVVLLHSHDARHLVQLGRTAEEAHSANLRGSKGLPV